jgi:hypothetical protein
MKFQHNFRVDVTLLKYNYVKEYKKQLLQNVTNLLNELNIRFVISPGNLIEYERKKPIYHDDDLDIRFCIDDFPKWRSFCNDSNAHLLCKKHNITFDDIFLDFDKQLDKGIRIALVTFENPKHITIFESIQIYTDLVVSIANSKKHWIDYSIDYDNLRKIIFMGVETYAPNEEDTKRILSTEYGENYLIPNYEEYCL